MSQGRVQQKQRCLPRSLGGGQRKQKWPNPNKLSGESLQCVGRCTGCGKDGLMALHPPQRDILWHFHSYRLVLYRFPIPLGFPGYNQSLAEARVKLKPCWVQAGGPGVLAEGVGGGGSAGSKDHDSQFGFAAPVGHSTQQHTWARPQAAFDAVL